MVTVDRTFPLFHKLEDIICRPTKEEPVKRRAAHRSKGGCMRRRFWSSVLFGLVSTILACTSSSPVAPSSSPASQPSPFAAVAGRYDLTIEIDQSCRGIPPALRLRNYSVEVEDKGWHFAPVRALSGGYSVPVVGELWAVPPGGSYRFKWNGFDIGTCYYPETVGSDQLYICGDGIGTRDGSTISGEMNGTAFLEGGSRQGCDAPRHRFSLVRLE
jgi:hypothetical protein